MLCVKMAGSSSANTSAAPPSMYSTGMDDQCSSSSESDGDQDSEQRSRVTPRPAKETCSGSHRAIKEETEQSASPRKTKVQRNTLKTIL